MNSAPPMGGGPPTSGTGNVGVMPPPKSNVQFFSLNKEGGAPTPTANVMAAPPSGPSLNAPPGSGGIPASQTGMPMPPPPSMDNNIQPGAQGGHPGNVYGNAPAHSMAGMPAAFEQHGYGNQIPAGGQTTPGGVPGVGTDANNPSGGGQLPTLDEMDLSIQCDPSFMRSSVGKLVSSQSAATSSRIPLGLVCRPMAGDVGNENPNVQVVDFGSTGIVRCKRCRTYINPFVSWTDSGRRYRCSICGMLNDIPNSYFSHLDQNGQRRDKDTRPELSSCSVEFIAPADYMVRPPQPPVYFFVIDVSSMASSSGMLTSCVKAIKESLDSLPGLPRTQIGNVFCFL